MQQRKLTWSRLLPFQTTSIDSMDVSKSGAYRLSFKSDDDRAYVFYVSASDDLKTSLQSHLNETTNVCIKNYVDTKTCFFRYALIDDKDVLAATIRQAYRHYVPACNAGAPEGSAPDIEVNLT